MPFNVGETVGPYRVIEQLGQGGMATVYKAYHAALDRYVALKVLHPAFLEDPNFQARFQREARLVARLDHPNIVPIYDFAEHEGRPYLVMKFIEGETLKARLQRGMLKANEIWKVVDSVGAAMSYAHKRGILHRDIKPSNVILEQDGTIYLADFGLARIAQSGESTLTSDMILGTPQYISPEQAMGKSDLDEGTDIYSFGVMLYELTVGQVPFSADTPFSIIHDHIYSPLPLPHAINPNVPENVERVLLKALAKERADRYADIGSMIESFKQAWESSGVSLDTVTMTAPVRRPAQAAKTTAAARTPTPPPPSIPAATVAQPVTTAGKPKPAKKRSPWPYIAAGVLLAACCLFALVATRQGQDRLFNPEPTPATTPTTVPATVVKTHQPEIKPTLPPPPTESPEILAARQRAEENPDDPYAQLDLALAYWDNEQARPALETLNKGAELAGDDVAFSIQAGQKFADRQAWVASAAMYLRAMRLTGASTGATAELRDAFHEAVYKASSMPEMPNYVPFEIIGSVDQPIMLVSQARYALYHRSQEDGHAYLDDAKRLKPDLYEARLLEAEFDTKEEKYDQARQILNIILADLNTPHWIRIEAENVIRQIP